MVAGPLRPNEKRKWYSLTLRHLRMASRLLQSGFADGAVFHIYHAYECVISAMIAAHGYAVPPEGKKPLILPSGKTISVYPSPKGNIKETSSHKVRLIFFNQLADRTKPYFKTHSSLSRFLRVNDRMDSLYYDVNRDMLPYQVYNDAFARQVMRTVRAFAREVWQDIR